MSSPPTITVVIPAYNASATIGETLASALHQSHHDIEIIVVDDGSTDDTGPIVESIARGERRLKMIRKPNEGVGRARNTGIDAAQGKFIALLDADDLWHPRKLELQFRKLLAESPSTGLVYNWFRPIDEQSRAVGEAAMPSVTGWVLHQHLEWNFISNGSSPLIKRDAIGNLRFDDDLRCEDYLFQLQLARRWRFSLVPAFLTGYRKRTGSRSTDSTRQIQAHINMFETLYPQLPPSAQGIARARIAQYWVEYMRNRLHRGQLAEAARAFHLARVYDPQAATSKILLELKRALRGVASIENRTAGTLPRPHFMELDPFEVKTTWQPQRTANYLARLKDLDDAYGRELGPMGSRI